LANDAKSFQGTGLGLNIFKKYVELLSGEISLESGRGKGTAFSTKFPVNWRV